MEAVTSPLSTAKRIVVKIGSALLVDYESARPRQGWLHALAEDIVRFKQDGGQAVIVSSGSIALGRFTLGLKRSAKLEEKQAAAAAGQSRLMHAYETAFATHRVPVAQALLEACDGVLLSTTLRAPDMDAEAAPFLGPEADEVADFWLHAVDVMLDAGHCSPGPTSIIDCTLPASVVVRQGFQAVDAD